MSAYSLCAHAILESYSAVYCYHRVDSARNSDTQNRHISRFIYEDGNQTRYSLYQNMHVNYHRTTYCERRKMTLSVNSTNDTVEGKQSISYNHYYNDQQVTWRTCNE